MLINKNFMRLFPLYRAMEFDAETSGQLADECMEEIRKLRKKAESDAALIESLNRYIATLETKAAYQAETLADLKRRLEEIAAKKNLTE
jgi:chromosome segregation ATPase